MASEGIARLDIQPLEDTFTLRDRVYRALRQAIISMNIYASPEEQRLDERQISSDLGVSRTPIREAITRLEQEGFVRVVQRRGVFVVRKSKKEVIEMITVWAALEGMAARLITLHGSQADIASLRKLFATFDATNTPRAHIDEYSELNIEFHQKILQMSRSSLINQIAENLFAHMRSIRLKTIGEGERPEKSIKDHMHIIEALESRDTALAETLARQHTLDLAAHVENNVQDLS